MTNGRKSRSKGRRGEQDVVKLLKSWGLEAKRTGYHQVFGGTESAPDVQCGSLCYEVKWQEGIADRLWEWVARHDALWLKKNGKPWLVVLPVEEYRRLITK